MGQQYQDIPDLPDTNDMIYGQRACEIDGEKVITGRNKWEDHDDIRVRGEIPQDRFRVSGELFYLKNLPPVPILRCDTVIPSKDLQGLKQNYVLLDWVYKLM